MTTWREPDQRTVRDLLAEAVDIAAKRRDWVRGDNAALGREDDEYDGHRRDFDHDALKIALRLATVVDALSDEVCDLRERLAELEESRRG